MRRIAALTSNPVMIALCHGAGRRRLRLQEDAQQCRRSRPRRRRGDARLGAGLHRQCRRPHLLRYRFLGRSAPTPSRHSAAPGAVAEPVRPTTRSRSKAMPTSAAPASTTWRSAPAAPPPPATIWSAAGVPAKPHEDHLLRQGDAGRRLRRHLLLVAEPPRRHRARRRRQLRRITSGTDPKGGRFGRLFRVAADKQNLAEVSAPAKCEARAMRDPRVSTSQRDPMHFRLFSAARSPPVSLSGTRRSAGERSAPASDQPRRRISLPGVGLSGTLFGRRNDRPVQLAQASDPRVTALEEQVRHFRHDRGAQLPDPADAGADPQDAGRQRVPLPGTREEDAPMPGGRVDSRTRRGSAAAKAPGLAARARLRPPASRTSS